MVTVTVQENGEQRSELFRGVDLEQFGFGFKVSLVRLEVSLGSVFLEESNHGRLGFPFFEGSGLGLLVSLVGVVSVVLVAVVALVLVVISLVEVAVVPSLLVLGIAVVTAVASSFVLVVVVSAVSARSAAVVVIFVSAGLAALLLLS